MKKVFDVYCDPGHGWVKVPRKMLATLGIADKITTYSYERDDFVYLEEDCDAGTFVNAYEAHYGVSPQWREHYADKSSRIRNYYHYSKRGSQE
jgi:hypothetical protein